MFKKEGNLDHIDHQMDIFHKSVKITGKLKEAASKKGNESLRDWIAPILNHFWHSAKTCAANTDLLVDKCVSVLRHVSGQQAWHGGQCKHDELEVSSE